MMDERDRVLLAYADRISEAAMKFSVECACARRDLERMLRGHEPWGPAFVSPRKAVVEYLATRGRRKA